MKTLKAFVVGMGILLVLGLALVGYGLARNAHRLTVEPASAGVHPPGPEASVPLAGGPHHAPFALDLPLPAGSHVAEMGVAGDRVVVRLAGGEAGDRILVLDPQSGQLAGTISLTASRPISLVPSAPVPSATSSAGASSASAALPPAKPGQIPRRDPPAH